MRQVLEARNRAASPQRLLLCNLCSASHAPVQAADARWAPTRPRPCCSFNMIEAARVVGVKRFFYASSACIYPGAQPGIPPLERMSSHHVPLLGSAQHTAALATPPFCPSAHSAFQSTSSWTLRWRAAA